MSLFEFFRKAPEYIQPDHEALEESGADRPRYEAYHRRIVKIAVLFGVVGALGGIITVLLATPGQHPGDRRAVFLAPFLSGIAGAFFGMAIACLFAPREFLTGPLGRKWMKLIGTENVLIARIVCALVGLIGLLPLVAIIHDVMKGTF